MKAKKIDHFLKEMAFLGKFYRGLEGGASPPPEAPPTCARPTPHVNVDSWKKVRHLPPFGVLGK